TAIPDPAPEPQAGGSPTAGRAALSPARLVYWSVLREFWEHRWIYIGPLIVAGVFLAGVVIGAFHLPLIQAGGPRPLPPPGFGRGASDFAALVLMLTYLVVTVIYSLGALHGERSDRSILFWKSLPVSDVMTVIAKASIPIVALPLITFVIIVVTQGIMSLAVGAASAGGGVAGSTFWAQTPLLPMWAAMLYHL